MVTKIRRNTIVSIIWYKELLVAKSYLQEQGVDFDEVFTLVAHLKTIRLLVTLATGKG